MKKTITLTLLILILLLVSCTAEVEIARNGRGEFSPSPGSIVKFSNVKFEWNVNVKADSYKLEITEKGYPPIVIEGIKDNEYIPQEQFLVPGREYAWRVMAESNGIIVYKSPDIDFKTASTDDPVDPTNTPPATPSTPMPASGALNVPISPVLSWEASDPDGDELMFYIYLGESFPPKLWKITNSTQVELELEPGKTYYWRVVARDSKKAYSAGEVWTFQTVSGSNEPPKFIEFYPMDGAISVPTNVTLRWNAEDPDNDVIEYKIYLSTDEEEVLYRKREAIVMDWNATTTYEASLEPYMEYYWMVAAKDSYGAIVYSPVMSFKTALPGNVSPGIITMFPTNTNIGPNFNDVLLTWEATDADGGKLTYYVYFDETYPPRFWGVTEATSIVIEGLKPYRRYYWRLAVKDDEGDLVYSDVYHINTGLLKSATSITVIGVDRFEAVEEYGEIYFVAGSRFSVMKFSRDYLILPPWRDFGSSDSDSAKSIFVDESGNIVIAGSTNNGFDGEILILDSELNVLKDSTFGGSSDDVFSEVLVRNDGTIVTVGYTSSTDGDLDGIKNNVNYDMWIVYSSDTSQSTVIGDDLSITEKAYAAVFDEYENLVIAGASDSTGYISKIGHWEYSTDTVTEFYDLIKIDDGYVAVGTDGSSAVVLKLTEEGSPVWIKRLNGEEARAVVRSEKNVEGIEYLIVGVNTSDGARIYIVDINNGWVEGYRGYEGYESDANLYGAEIYDMLLSDGNLIVVGKRGAAWFAVYSPVF